MRSWFWKRSKITQRVDSYPAHIGSCVAEREELEEVNGMKEAWNVEVWGVRGSSPVTYGDFSEYGGSTSCFFVKSQEEAVIFDGGSGLLELGKSVLKRDIKRVHILISHLHMDHICGLFGFPLFLDPKAEVHLYGSAKGDISFSRCMEQLLGPPFWPIGFHDFKAHVKLHEVVPGNSFQLEGTEAVSTSGLIVYTLPGNHPGGSLLYRLEQGGRSIVYGLDCEMDERMFRALLEFAQDSSLLIWDANFTDVDLERCKGWGHSSWRQGLALGKAAGVKRVLMTHYSKEYTDEVLQKQQELAKGEDDICRFAKEGMVIQI